MGPPVLRKVEGGEVWGGLNWEAEVAAVRIFFMRIETF
jgi:hypothetical protein